MREGLVPMSRNTTGEGAAESLSLAEQIARLRADVEALAAKPLDEAARAAEHWGANAEREIEAFAKTVRDRPIAALAVAIGVGFVLGRIMR
jgi:ElaB/YqjD/DUF883 family membrane-anchored ribosome-binding protein